MRIEPTANGLFKEKIHLATICGAKQTLGARIAPPNRARVFGCFGKGTQHLHQIPLAAHALNRGSSCFCSLMLSRIFEGMTPKSPSPSRKAHGQIDDTGLDQTSSLQGRRFFQKLHISLGAWHPPKRRGTASPEFCGRCWSGCGPGVG